MGKDKRIQALANVLDAELRRQVALSAVLGAAGEETKTPGQIRATIYVALPFALRAKERHAGSCRISLEGLVAERFADAGFDPGNASRAAQCVIGL